MAPLEPQRSSMMHQRLRTSDLKGSLLGREGVERVKNQPLHLMWDPHRANPTGHAV